MINSLYPPFRKWTETGTLWIYSDPHFSDPEMVELRKNYISDDEQILRINSKVGKKDSIIFLGDIGNEELVRKIRGYKILIMGNHDKGATKYKRQIFRSTKYDKSLFTKDEVYKIVSRKYPKHKITIHEDYSVTHSPYEYWFAHIDNELFDEVYEGPLFIAEKLILSHEPVYLNYAFNIHGHDHSGTQATDDRHLNVCAEHIDYTPVNVNRLIKNGLTSKVDSIHRMTIDNAVERRNTWLL